jgi:hypothetical protein
MMADYAGASLRAQVKSGCCRVRQNNPTGNQENLSSPLRKNIPLSPSGKSLV